MKVTVRAGSRFAGATTPDIVDAFDGGGPIVVRRLRDDPTCHPAVGPRLGRRIDRSVAIALVLASELAGALPEHYDPERVGVFIANTWAGWNFALPQLMNLINRGAAAVSPYQATAWFPAAAQGEVTIKHGFRGISKTVSGDAAGGALAAMLAADAIVSGHLDWALVGAIESVVEPLVATAFVRRVRRDVVPSEDGIMLLLGRGAPEDAGIAFRIVPGTVARAEPAPSAAQCTASLGRIADAWAASESTARAQRMAVPVGLNTELEVLVQPSSGQAATTPPIKMPAYAP